MNSVTSKVLSFLLILCVSACLASVVYHMFNQDYKTETAIYAEADASETFKGLYIRNEEVVRRSDASGVISYNVSDGGKLGMGSAIAEVYADESQIDIKQQLESLQAELEVLKKIQNPGTTEAAQPSNLSELISESYRNIITDREKGDYRKISSGKEELLILLSTYQKVTDKSVDFSQRISDIIAQISSLKSSETVPLDTITSDRSAYFVSYADGYEGKFTKENLSTLTVKAIDEAKDSGSVDDEGIVGKLIDGYEWYVAGVIDNSKMQYAADEKVTLKFQSTSVTADGVIYDIRETGDSQKSIVIVKCDELNHDLVQHRTERVEMIKGEYEGIKVPRKAIRFRKADNEKGVYVKLGEQILFKKLEVVYEGDDYVLSKLNAGDDFISLYDDIVVEGVDTDGD